MGMFTRGGRVRPHIAKALEASADWSGIASPPEWADRSHMAQITAELLFDHLDMIPVTRDTALGVPAIDRAHQLITGQLSTFPLEHRTGGKRSAVQPLMVTQPEDGRQASETWRWIADGQFFYGRAWLIVTDRYAPAGGAARGYPRRVRYAPEWHVQTDTEGRVVEAYGKPVQPHDVIRVPSPHSGILNRPKTIREAVAIELAAFNAAQNPVPSINLHQTGGTPLTQDQVDALVAGWVAARTKRGTGGVAFTNQSIEATAMGQQPEQLLIAGRNAVALNVSRMANLAPYWLGASVDGNSMTYQNVQSAGRELTDYTLAPYLAATAGRLSMPDVFASGQTVQHITARLTHADLKDTATTLKTLVDGKIITPEQAQRVLGGESLEAVL
ncbi:portal protein [Curtobacterium phage Penoan]|nr:portal protein [Curtobacterium phage Penoan]